MEPKKRIVTKIGNIFCIKVDEETKKYFQYIAIDRTYMGSSVIRAFARRYAVTETPKLKDVVCGEIEFYAHTVLRWGIELEAWEKVGNVPFTDEQIDVLFLEWMHDDMMRNGLVSPLTRWRYWRVNDPEFSYEKNAAFAFVDYDIKVCDLKYTKDKFICDGGIHPGNEIVHRMKTGKYTYKLSWPRWPRPEEL